MDLFHVSIHLHLLTTLPLIHSTRLGKASKPPRPPLNPTTEAARNGRQAWVRSVYLETGPPFDVRGLGGSAAAATPCGGQPLAGDTPRQATVRWSALIRRLPTQTQRTVPAVGAHIWARQSGNQILCKFQQWHSCRWNSSASGVFGKEPSRTGGTRAILNRGSA